MTDLLTGIPFRDGATYIHQRDGQRLHAQHNAIYALMKDEQWRSLAEIAEQAKCPETSASARLRDFRKPRFQKLYGPHAVERRNLGGGMWVYRLVRK